MLLKEFANVSGAASTSIAAAGTTLATGTVVPDSATFIEVTAASGTNGVTLVAGDSGKEVLVYPSAVTNALLVYPPTASGQINEGTAGTAFSVASRKPCRFKQLDSAGIRWIAQLSA